MLDVATALDVLVPAAKYGGSLTANTREAFDALRWEDDRPKPSWADVEAAMTPDPTETLAREREGMVCSRFQAKAALLQAGLLDQVQVAVDDAEPFVRIAWAEASEFRRNSPTIAALAKSVDMTDEQVDDLFRAAMEIEA